METVKIGPMLGHGKAYSSRDGINIILPGTGDWVGNSHYTRGYDPLGQIELVRKVVLGEIARTRETIRLWPDHPEVVVSVRETVNRGAYDVTVWGAE